MSFISNAHNYSASMASRISDSIFYVRGGLYGKYWKA